jgi:hypothetical protein|tara:strand:+ start:1776 stop:1952 length:177 start_codon:yes stop_codon:yes gene_type:complete
METDEPVVEWAWAVEQISYLVEHNREVVNRLEVGALSPEEKDLYIENIEKAWHRILQG